MFRQSLILGVGNSTLQQQLIGRSDETLDVATPANWSGLLRAVVRAPSVPLVVLDAEFGENRNCHAAGVRRLICDFPSVHLLVAVGARSDSARMAAHLGALGVREVVPADGPGAPPELVCRIDEASTGLLPLEMEGALEREMGNRLWARARRVAHSALRRQKQTDLARSMGLAPRTLVRRFRADGLPTPGRLAAWMRLLIGSALLDDPGRTLASAGRAAGYGCGCAFRQAIRQFLASKPKDIRAAGAFRQSLAAFTAELHADLTYVRARRSVAAGVVSRQPVRLVG